jgi:hypothetical protein
MIFQTASERVPAWRRSNPVLFNSRQWLLAVLLGRFLRSVRGVGGEPSPMYGIRSTATERAMACG